MSISVEGITKVFKGRKKGDPENVVLKDVSFNVEEGEFVSLLGPSGCGKTTTLTIIAGFRKANEGKIVVNGNEVKKPGTDRSFMFQNYALFPWLKVGENIEYPMKKMKVRAPYTAIPERLVINVDSLGLGKSLQVGEIHFEGLELMNAKNAVVCAVQLTRAARGAAAAAEK